MFTETLWVAVHKNKRYTLVGSLQFGQRNPQGVRKPAGDDFPGARGVMAVWYSWVRVVELIIVFDVASPGKSFQVA